MQIVLRRRDAGSPGGIFIPPTWDLVASIAIHIVMVEAYFDRSHELG